MSKHLCNSWDANGVCTDPDCKKTKLQEELDAIETDLAEDGPPEEYHPNAGQGGL